ncbi:replication-associated recombination protein A [Clostridia bacterium]|nr:replication-associated recombination protein A [Clostridia bacterium]
MDIFDVVRKNEIKKNEPLAKRMSPRNFNEYIGQRHILAEGKMLRRVIDSDQLTSIILYGPPGTGKTALARLIARQTKADFQVLNAVTSGVKDIKEVVAGAKDNLGMYSKKSILFIDEIHRFNKSQQDALLPHVEEGLVVLIGATTENPYVEVNRALLSRSTIYRLNPLSSDELEQVLMGAVHDTKRGYGQLDVEITPEAMNHLTTMPNGDARMALNALELAVLTTTPNTEGVIRITLEVAQESIQKRAIAYDKAGDNHYDIVSAFIKSMRASKPDAALHYMLRMLKAGEDPRYITRRMMIFAAEDIGLMDPQALSIATAADYALKNLGLPEAYYPLSEACIYLSTVPKSNACKVALKDALQDIESADIGEVPPYLQDNNYPKPQKDSQEENLYIYPPEHNYQTDQEYMPNTLIGKKYYKERKDG